MKNKIFKKYLDYEIDYLRNRFLRTKMKDDKGLPYYQLGMLVAYINIRDKFLALSRAQSEDKNVKR